MDENEMILPEGFEENTDLPESGDFDQDYQEDETSEDFELDTNETESDEESIEEGDDSEQETEPFLTVKYDKEDINLDMEKAKELAQKGLNYDRIYNKVQEFENDPRINFVEQLADEYGMSSDELIQSLVARQEEEQLNELIQNNIPEEYAKEMIESRKFRQEFEQQKQQEEQQKAEQQQYMEFFDYYKEVNGKDYNPQEQLPAEVLEATQDGTPLKYAYMQHHNKQLMNQIKVLKQNQTNSKRAPITSTTTHGSTGVTSEDPFLAGFNSY